MHYFIVLVEHFQFLTLFFILSYQSSSPYGSDGFFEGLNLVSGESDQKNSFILSCVVGQRLSL
ncbi:hypothetical protein pb186bvf_008451 [Paramecium bursaria]